MRAVQHQLGSWVLCLGAVSGCATSIDTRPVNAPVARHQIQTMPQAPAGSGGGENVIGLSFSGGGLRAAAFAFGVLQALNDEAAGQSPLLGDVRFISSVSGGSLTAAYYGLHGPAMLTHFKERVLLQDMERGMRLSVFSPGNLVRMLDGGLNDRGNLAEWLHRDVFANATFADMQRRGGPPVWINATDVYNRTPFVFTEPVFDALCSDLASFPLAEAVHASLAVPLVFAPVVLETFNNQCATPLPAWVERYTPGPDSSALRTAQAVAQAVRNYRNPAVQRYVKLVDGGVTDNYGLSSIVVARAAAGTPHAPMSAADAVRVGRMLFIVVDAGRAPSGDWAMKPGGPSGIDLALAATDSAIDSATRISFDGFSAMLAQWQDDLQRFRCNLTLAEVAALRGPEFIGRPWNCRDVQFSISLVSFGDLGSERAASLNQIPTRLTLPAADIDAAIKAGRDVIEMNPALRDYRAKRLHHFPSDGGR